nr:hypothetical protein [Tanacetum cinerariifolium]
MNPRLNTRLWTRKDVDRCKAFMFAIQRRLRTRRIFRNLESFGGGRDQTLVLKMKARLDQTLMKPLKARLDQTMVMLEL